MFGFSSLLLAFRNDERVFLHLDWLEGACIVLRHFSFTLLFSFLSFPSPLSFTFFYLSSTLVIYISLGWNHGKSTVWLWSTVSASVSWAVLEVDLIPFSFFSLLVLSSSLLSFLLCTILAWYTIMFLSYSFSFFFFSQMPLHTTNSFPRMYHLPWISWLVRLLIFLYTLFVKALLLLLFCSLTC